MTAAQPNLLDVGPDARNAPPVIVGRGLRCTLQVEGRSVTGDITLDQPNPRGRVRCRICYMRPADWTPAQHQAALAVAAHWFRDIGGFALIEKAELCHIAQRLKRRNSRAALASGEGHVTEEDLHAAVSAYAASDWHRQGQRWMSLQRFFTGSDWKTWRDKAPDPQLERDRAQRKAAAEAAVEQHMEEQRRRDREQAAATARANAQARAAAAQKRGEAPAPTGRRPRP